MPAILQRKGKGKGMAIILKANNVFSKEELHNLHEMYMKQLNDGLIILQGGIHFVYESTEAHEIEILQEEQTPAADPQRELHITRMRLQHLLQSEFIRSFDMKDLHTGDYVRDISDADRIAVPQRIILEQRSEPIANLGRWFRRL